MHGAGFKAGDRLARRGLGMGGPSGCGLPPIAGATFAARRNRTTPRSPPLAPRCCGPVLAAARSPRLAKFLRARAPFGPALAARGGRTTPCAPGGRGPKFGLCPGTAFGPAIGA